MFLKALQHLYIILYKPDNAYLHLNKIKPQNAWQLWQQLHLPLLLLYVIASTIAPWNHLQEKFPWQHLYLPPLFIIATLIFASIYDRVLENSSPKTKIDWHDETTCHVALYFHLIMNSACFFFFLYPKLGYIVLSFMTTVASFLQY